MMATQKLVSRFWGLAVCTLALTVTATASAADQGGNPSPHEVVRGTSVQLVELIEEAREYADESPERYHTEVQLSLIHI